VTSEFHPVCGCLGCREPRVDIVHIPDVGQRAVCRHHLEDSEVANDEDTREEPSEAAENHEEPTDAGGDADEAASDATRDADA